MDLQGFLMSLGDFPISRTDGPAKTVADVCLVQGNNRSH